MFGKNKPKKGTRVYMTSNGMYGKIEMIRGGLIKVKIENNSLEIWVKPDEIQSA